MRFSVRSALTALLMAVLGFTVAVVGGTAHYNARFAIEDLATQRMDEAADRIRLHVHSVLNVAVSQCDANRNLFAAGAVQPDDHERMTQWFLAALRAQQSLSYLSFGREDGKYWHVYRDQEGTISAQWLLPNEAGAFDLIDFSPEPDGSLRETTRDRDTARTPPYERPYYESAKAAGAATWPETYIFLSAGGNFDAPALPAQRPSTRGSS